MRPVFAVGYFGSWVVSAALLVFIPIALVWEMADVSYLTGIDDDITLLALPTGAAFGVWAAVRTRRTQFLHRVCAISGLLLMLMGTLMANWFLQSSQQAAGSGPFAGLGELAGVGMSIGIAGLGACMCGIWAFARLSHPR